MTIFVDLAIDVPVTLVDLVILIRRLEQADQEGSIKHDGSAAERLITSDLPRLKAYVEKHGGSREPSRPESRTVMSQVSSPGSRWVAIASCVFNFIPGTLGIENTSREPTSTSRSLKAIGRRSG